MLSWSGGRVLVSSGGARHSTGSASTELAFLNGNGAERASWSRQSADPVEPLPLRTVRVLGFLFGNWYARAYLLGCRRRGRPGRAGALDREREGESRRRLISWKAATCWKAADSRPRQGRRVNPSSGEHDRVAAADGPAIDHRGVDADVYSIVLSGRP
jgi:hypothetical protein